MLTKSQAPSHVRRAGEIVAVQNDRGCDREHDGAAQCGLGVKSRKVPGGTEMNITSKILPSRVGWKAVAVGLGVILEFP